MELLDRISRPSGWFTLRVFRDGHLVESVDEPNLIVAQYAAINALLLAGNGGYGIRSIGFGTNGTAPQMSDTGLTRAYLKSVDSIASTAAGQTVFGFSLGATEGNGLSIAEFGLLTSAGAMLYARKVRAIPLVKTAAISFNGTWTIQS